MECGSKAAAFRAGSLLPARQSGAAGTAVQRLTASGLRPRIDSSEDFRMTGPEERLPPARTQSGMTGAERFFGCDAPGEPQHLTGYYAGT